MKKQLFLLFGALQLMLFAQTSFLVAQTIYKRTELPLAVIVCSYNNALWVDKNLDSILMQDYSNYRIVYIDDASEDGTADLVRKYMQEHDKNHKITLQANSQRTRKTKNVYNAFHSCQDNEIIVIVDGDDWLDHDQVFAQINQTYLYNDVWLTWGQFKMSEKMTRGWGQPVPQELIESNDFREFTWVYGAPRTFYAWLFKQVKLEDFIALTVQGYEGKFYPSSDDFAMMYPMLEMAHTRIAFIPENAYIVNQYNPLSTSNAKPADPLVSMQTACEVKMYKKRYQPLDEPKVYLIEQLQDSKADVVIMASTASKTAALCKALTAHVKNIGSVVVCHQGASDDYQRALKTDHAVTYLSLPSERTAFLQAISALPHEHVLLMHDDITLLNACDCRQGIIDLERTGALGCYYQVSPALLTTIKTPCQHIRDQLYAWKITLEGNHQLQEHGYDMSLYRKKDIANLIMLLDTPIVTEMKDCLPKRTTNLHAIGLCYQQPCATSTQLLAKPFTRDNADYHVVDFDKAMYATEKHKTIYQEIASSPKEASFLTILRAAYNEFFQNPQFSAVPRIPKIIHHIWLGGPMPEQYVQWRKKWQDMHPDWIFMLWTDKEVANFDLENQRYYDETTSYGEKANLLRYELLYQFGGLYVDTDCECFRPFDFLHHCCDFYAGCEYPQRSYAGSRVMIGNSIMASRAGHPMVKEFIDGIQYSWDQELQVARSGTRYATDIIRKTLQKNDHDTIMIFPANIFYPWATELNPWEEPITGQESFVQPETWSLHYWHFTWKPKSKSTVDLTEETREKYYKERPHQKAKKQHKEKNQTKKRLLKKREHKG